MLRTALWFCAAILRGERDVDEATDDVSVALGSTGVLRRVHAELLSAGGHPEFGVVQELAGDVP